MLPRSMTERIVQRARTAVQFVTAQSLTMAANLLYGLLCVRLLPASEYAKFVVVFGVQGTILVLMDANVSGTLIPLVGERVDDRRLIADYVASLRQISRWAYYLIGFGVIICYPSLVRHRDWSLPTIAGMVAALLLSTWFMRVAAAYGAVVILLRDRTTWYKGQLISSFGTLALLGVFWAMGWLGAFQAILINISGIIFVAIFCFYRANGLLGGPGVAGAEKRRSIMRLALPNVPQAIFYALQGQLSLFLITFYGHVKAVASVGALGRLGQVFALFFAANSLLVEPYFAKLAKERLKSSYAICLTLAAAVSTSVFLCAVQVPALFLWVLGPQYTNLRFEAQLAIGTGAISFFSGVLWGIHTARRFIYWWNVALSIGLTILVQILFIVRADISTVRGVLWLNLGTNTVSLFVNILSGAYGFIKGPREAEQRGAVPRSDEIIEAAAEAAAAMESYTVESGPNPIAFGVKYSGGPDE